MEMGRRYRADEIALRDSLDWLPQVQGLRGGGIKNLGRVQKKGPVYNCNTTIVNIGINK